MFSLIKKIASILYLSVFIAQYGNCNESHITLSQSKSKMERRGAFVNSKRISDPQLLALSFKIWAKSLRECDPRYQILEVFEDVTKQGENTDLLQVEPVSSDSARASTFSVWRPTSQTAIRQLMLKKAVGKGLDIKGKSAKQGKLSGFIPFLQINEDDVKNSLNIDESNFSSKILLYFAKEQSRDAAFDQLSTIESNKKRDCIFQMASNRVAEDDVITKDDRYSPHSYGIELSFKLFWSQFILQGDCNRKIDSDYYPGRSSDVYLQEQNIDVLINQPEIDSRRVVLWQNSETVDVMSPLNLLMAYEEGQKVLPVVSDFDSFLIGTKGVNFDESIAAEQVTVAKWSIDSIEKILTDKRTSSWTKRWYEIIEKSREKGGFKTIAPKFGFGDLTSNAIMEEAVARCASTGSVRHASECFNYTFPQEMDDHYLVISDNLPHGKLWTYMNVPDLQKFLAKKIEEGFSFPLNPKWILCDSGWHELYQKMLDSKCPRIQKSIEAWYPVDSGIRESIASVHKNYPEGFVRRELVNRKRSSIEVSQEEIEKTFKEVASRNSLRGSFENDAKIRKGFIDSCVEECDSESGHLPNP